MSMLLKTLFYTLTILLLLVVFNPVSALTFQGRHGNNEHLRSHHVKQERDLRRSGAIWVFEVLLLQ